MKEQCVLLVNPAIGISKRIAADRELIRSILNYGVSEDSRRDLIGQVVDMTSETINQIELPSDIKAQLSQNLMQAGDLVVKRSDKEPKSILLDYDILYNEIMSALIHEIVQCECHSAV
jgi:hypothetical protein